MDVNSNYASDGMDEEKKRREADNRLKKTSDRLKSTTERLQLPDDTQQFNKTEENYKSKYLELEEYAKDLQMQLRIKNDHVAILEGEKEMLNNQLIAWKSRAAERDKDLHESNIRVSKYERCIQENEDRLNIIEKQIEN